ncbi:MAG TPA: ribosome-associated translation inhibitor RaiA [Alphaproteobacteria bacterium]|nr:ribosome-associated translation inhibitor RaiA [Alphaproteobacteria bacterium]
MHIQVHGKQIDVGSALRRATEEKIRAPIAKYFDGDASAIATYSRQSQQFSCDCLVHLSTGLTLQANGSADDAHIALDLAITHLEKRLRRYKRRLKDHRARPRAQVETVIATDYVIHDETESVGEEPASLDPMIVAELKSEVRSLTVGEAVMHMNLSDLPALLFINRGTGGFNMVYRRRDGNVGWVEPQVRSKRHTS